MRERIEGCPCCVGEADQALIHSRPLRELTADDHNHYMFNAMFTWGDEDDFRHFLPRLLELAVADTDWTGDPERVLGFLAYGKWDTWPKHEQVAIESLVRSVWNAGLTLDHSQFEADGWLCGIGRAGLDVISFIDGWRRLGASSTLGQVAEFLSWNSELLTDGTLTNAFWRDVEKRDVVAAELRDWLGVCLEDPEFRDRLAAWYERT